MDDIARFKQRKAAAEADSEHRRVEIQNHMAAFAFQGYREGGRGALVVDIDDCFGRENAQGTAWWYVVPGSERFDELAAPEKLIQLINTYNPKTGFVLVALNDGETQVGVNECNQEPVSLSPPEAYELIGDQGIKHHLPPRGDGAA
jgi:hypothetical protein